MPRVGFEKVKTGCKTCKIRKVKCDETWPQCQRCQKGGRICSGYQAPPAGSLSWNLLLRPQPSVTPASDDRELRSLAFFHQAVAPVLSGPFDPSFWTYLVAQSTHHEPAARHAVLAVSSLFENFSETTLSVMNDPFAIQHYNKAIQGLLKAQIDDIDTILTVCVLFICIELLRGENEAALNHARHGVRLLKTRGGSSQLAAVFCHVNLFTLFFGPELDVAVIIADLPEPRLTFQGMIEAKHHLDILMGKTLYLVRRTEQWQIGMSPENGPTPEMFQEQSELIAAYTHWGHSFARFEAREGIDTKNDAGSLALKIRWKMATIWVPNCLAGSESIYDKHVDEANYLIEMAQYALAINARQSAGRPRKFMFDMGFSHVLHLLAIKCRYLEMRLRAVELLKGLACERESLWDANSMLAVGRKVIEVEHGVALGTDPLETLKDSFADAKLPAEKDRVRGCLFEDAYVFRPKEGVRVYRRPLRLIMYGPDGGPAQRREWVTIYT